MKPILLSLLVLLFGLSCPAQDRNSSIANPDTIDVWPMATDTVKLLVNDIIAPGDSISRVDIHFPGYMRYTYFNYTTGEYVCYSTKGHGGTDTASYYIHFKDTTFIHTSVFIRLHDKSTAFLDTNNVKALFFADGTHFFRDSAQYYVPKASNQTTLFASSLWIGGKDEQGDLHLAAYKFGQGPNITQSRTHFDYWAGPVMDTVYYTTSYDTVWNRIWVIRKNEIEEYKANWWSPWYKIPKDILEWPGNGDVLKGQAAKLAPFHDMNGDGFYDPLNGDYPEVRGDKCLYFIFNDDRIHTETTGKKLRIEVHGMAYAFDLPNDTAIKNTVFVNYRIYNRSDHTYDSTFLSFFNDVDLGYSKDDYSGCDVERNMSFIYNGLSTDGTGQYHAYGLNPPAQGFILLSGPLMDPDGIDNAKYDSTGIQLCDFSVNGRKFKDHLADNERLGMTTCTVTNNAGVPSYMQDPRYPSEYYNLMIHILGGPYSNDDYIRFMYPGLSDSTGWGFDCIPIEDWTEFTSGNIPDDRRNETSSGPFTFVPGDVQEIDFAYVWARDYDNPNPASVDKLRWCADQIIHAFETNTLSDGSQIYGINDLNTRANNNLKIYPNPASGEITLEMPAGSQSSAVQLINSTGIIVRTFSSTANKQTLNLSGISSGIYLIRITTNSGVYSEKLIKK